MGHGMRSFEILADGLKFPEGPVFDPQGRLWFVEIDNATVDRLEPGGGITRFHTGGRPNGLACDHLGRIYVADKDRKILRLDPRSGQFEELAIALDGRPLDEPNDICFDDAGNLLFTCPGGSARSGTGYVCRLTPAGKLSAIARGFRYPNGLALDRSGKRLFVAESAPKRLLVGDYPGKGGVVELTPWADTGGAGGPDGFALDAEGNIYTALFGSGELAVVSPRGAVIERIALAGKKPTNCAFDPSGKLGLVVTEVDAGTVTSITPMPPGLSMRDGRS
ncbi:MAG: Lactonase drp35 [Phycisphaerae bacterium]|nr:Lactonase drp35 [Phycisphaerae bacterium]